MPASTTTGQSDWREGITPLASEQIDKRLTHAIIASFSSGQGSYSVIFVGFPVEVRACIFIRHLENFSDLIYSRHSPPPDRTIRQLLIRRSSLLNNRKNKFLIS